MKRFLLLFCFLAGLQLPIMAMKTDRTLLAEVNLGHISQAIKLIESGTDLDKQNTTGATALMIATTRGYETIVDALIDVHANLDLQDSDGWTGLMMATINGRANIVQRLITAGADKTLKNRDGETARSLAAGDTEILKILDHADAV